MKISFLGAGKMGGAILESLIKTKTAKASQITIFETNVERAAELSKRLKVKNAATLNDALGGADVVFLAVKPQDLGALCANVKTNVPLFVSIAAGKKTAWLEAALPPKSRVVRAMPNLAVAVGAGMSGICAGANAKKSDVRLAARLLSCAGKAVVLPESQFDAVTALSGSGPAFFAYFLQTMIDAGAALGFDNETASTLATQTFLGTALVLKNGEPKPEDFMKAVASPKGTTAAGLEVLEKSALRSTVAKTLAAAAKRGKELSA
ncbi:MAG: pyrroline-5-carboxylate reductase [Kiritimatiellaeota bacterium]|nr:pyrroline-5-carboxylate reductase [Kiritimatiellota bacterium]